MKTQAVVLGLLFAAGTMFAAEGPVPKGVTDLDHVFLIMMENHGYSQILNNPNAPFINQLANSAGYATNYFAVGHPSSTNYLEIVGGSNFGVRSDDYPNWHSTCMPNLATGVTTFDKPAASPALVCPIWGTGIDAATPATDCTNEVQTTPPNCYIDITNTTLSIPAAANTIAKTIAHQLVEHGRSWKSYQENLPSGGADGVNYSDGFFTNNTNFASFLTTPSSFTSWSAQNITVPAIMTQSDANNDIVYLYAAKHNPFVYFRDVQESTNPRNSLSNVVGFNSLYQDLGSGDVPDFSFIVPNQCNDQHGRSNAGPFCNFDESDNGTQTGLNEALILQGDVIVQRIVTSIKNSDTWKKGKNAIVVVWDENDYTATPNQVLLIVDTNYGDQGVKSSQFYTHFSLLRSLESGFDLPCLNHACDAGVNVMTDLFGK